MMTLDLLLWSLSLAVAGFVYIDMLLEPGAILHFVRRWIEGRIQSEYLLKPLVHCMYCFSGQLSLWGYFFISSGYDPVQHILFITQTILIVRIINRIIYG